MTNTQNSTETASELELGQWRIVTRKDGFFDGLYTAEEGDKIIWRHAGRANKPTGKTAKAAELTVRPYAEVQASIRDLRNFVPTVVREGTE